ncbi:MAG: metallophosphoesterase [Acutalibacteraceae bacterium]
MIYAVSDLHGYPLEGFLSLLSKAGFCDNDFLFILGDVIDRGSDGIRILEYLLDKPNIQLILGNHEAMMLSCSFITDIVTDEFLNSLDDTKLSLLQTWLHNGAAPTIKAIGQTAKTAPDRIDSIYDYLCDAPLYDTVTAGSRDFVLTHSGLGGYSPGKKLSEYSDSELLWHRPDLSEQYSEKFFTVFGHTPTAFYGEEYSGKALKTNTWINIDAGVACGEKPMLLRLDDMKEFYL